MLKKKESLSQEKIVKIQQSNLKQNGLNICCVVMDRRRRTEGGRPRHDISSVDTLKQS